MGDEEETIKKGRRIAWKMAMIIGIVFFIMGMYCTYEGMDESQGWISKEENYSTGPDTEYDTDNGKFVFGGFYMLFSSMFFGGGIWCRFQKEH